MLFCLCVMANQYQIAKSVLSSPQLDEKDDMATLRKAAMVHEIVNENVSLASQEMHENRIKTLRKETEYLKETEWKYEPIEHFIGQR